MKKILFLLLFIPVCTEAQTTKTTTANNTYIGVQSVSGDNRLLPADNKALIVIDGVIRNNYERQTSSPLVSFGSDPKPISRDNVESVTVLTGADATALYGASGANGAVIITTKK